MEQYRGLTILNEYQKPNGDRIVHSEIQEEGIEIFKSAP